MEKIVTPPLLKEKTRQMVLVQAAKHKTVTRIWRYTAIAAALVLLAGVGIWAQVWNNRITTGPDTDEQAGFLQVGHREVITLPNGELRFISLTTDDLGPTIKLSPSYPLRRNAPLEEYPDALPVQAPEGLSSPEGGVTVYFSDPSQPPAAVLGRAVYSPQSSMSVTVTFTNDTSMLFIPIEIGGSEIAGVTVGVGYLETGDTYYGAYFKNGYTVLLTAEGTQQQEFVRFLQAFVEG